MEETLDDIPWSASQSIPLKKLVLRTYLGTESHCTTMSCSERFGDDQLAALEHLLNKWFDSGWFELVWFGWINKMIWFG